MNTRQSGVALLSPDLRPGHHHPECEKLTFTPYPCPECDGEGAGRNFHSLSLDDGAWSCDACGGDGTIGYCEDCDRWQDGQEHSYPTDPMDRDYDFETDTEATA